MGTATSDEERLLDLIGDVYDLVVDDSRSCSLAQELAQMFDSDSCLVYFGRTLPGSAAMPAVAGILSATRNFDHWACSAYADYYHDRNEWYARAWKRPAPYVVVGQELIEPSALLRTEWSDYLRATRTLHVIGAQFPIQNDLIGLLGVHRSPSERPFDESDRARLKMLLPHLQRAMRMREKIRDTQREADVARGLLGDLSIGVVIVDAECRIVYSNEPAEKLLQAGGGLRVETGRLKAGSPDREAALKQAVRTATSMGHGRDRRAGTTLIVGSRGTSSLPVMVAPLPPESIRFGSVHPACALIFSDPDDRPNWSLDAFCRRYGLTLAQRRLLDALVRGQDLAGYAEAAQIGLGTAKTHLKEILSKTGQHRQVDLIRMVLSDPLARIWPSLDSNRPHGQAAARLG